MDLLTYVEVSGRPHLSVFRNHIDNQRVADKSNQHDEREEQRDQPGIGQEGMLISFLLILVQMHPSGDVALGSVDPHLLGGVPEPVGGGGVHGVRAEGGMGGRRAGWRRKQSSQLGESARSVHVPIPVCPKAKTMDGG